MDFSRYFRENSNQLSPEEFNQGPSFSNKGFWGKLKHFWQEADEKTKREVLILVAVIILIILVIVSGVLSGGGGGGEEKLMPPPAE